MNSEMTKAKRCRKCGSVPHQEMTFNPPKANLGMLAYGKGKMIHGRSHPGVPNHVIKAVEERRKTTLTGTRV